MHFLVQKIDNRIVHDFAFTLIQAKEYYDWLGEKMSIRFMDTPMSCPMVAAIPNPDHYIPVGSVEFVSAYLKQFYPDAVRALWPLNVPEPLFPFAGRRIANVWNKKDFNNFRELFPETTWGFSKEIPIYVKSLDTIKDKHNGPVDYSPYKYEPKDFRGCQISEIIDIDSEWRVFVFHNEIQYIANYAGEPTLFPDPKAITKMIETYSKEAPVAYTLDVGVTIDKETRKKKTVVVECHRFFSCGLYGFSDLRKYPVMLSQAWNEIKRAR